MQYHYDRKFYNYCGPWACFISCCYTYVSGRRNLSTYLSVSAGKSNDNSRLKLGSERIHRNLLEQRSTRTLPLLLKIKRARARAQLLLLLGLHLLTLLFGPQMWYLQKLHCDKLLLELKIGSPINKEQCIAEHPCDICSISYIVTANKFSTDCCIFRQNCPIHVHTFPILPALCSCSLDGRRCEEGVYNYYSQSTKLTLQGKVMLSLPMNLQQISLTSSITVGRYSLETKVNYLFIIYITRT